jgi:hypothetical protein
MEICHKKKPMQEGGKKQKREIGKNNLGPEYGWVH